MNMEVIPAIDLIGGKCVRLEKGDFRLAKTYEKDPLKQARRFQRAGFKKLHLIDLDGAKQGKIQNWKIIKEIAKSTTLSIEFGGGIQSEEDIRKIINAGIDKVIIGSLAIKEPKKFRKIFKQFGPERIVVAVDVRKGKICYHGWQKRTAKNLKSFLKALNELGVRNIIVTDIEKDGTLEGPNFALYKKLILEFPDLKVVAAGGIQSINDFNKLSKIGVAGAIVGKAIYERKILLNDLKYMAQKKIIPCLDCYRWRGKWKVVKGIKFENLREAGDPIKLAKKYSDEGADELAMLDISASQENRKPFFDLVKKVSKVIKIPLIVGGGIATLSDIEKILKLGASKVSLNTAVVRNPEFLTKVVKKFNAKRIVVAIDTKKRKQGWKVCILGGTKETNLDAIKWAKEVKKRGAGELLPTSKDKDGTKAGYDLQLLRKLKEETGLPIVASGGAGKKEHFLEVFTRGKADAALAASLFHFGEIKIPALKKYLKNKGIDVS